MIASRASGPRAYRSSSDTCSYIDNHPNIEENTSSPITMSGERRTHPLIITWIPSVVAISCNDRWYYNNGEGLQPS
jgi:hypothetical protein